MELSAHFEPRRGFAAKNARLTKGGSISGFGEPKTEAPPRLRLPAWKRPLDLALILATLPLWAPVAAALAAWIPLVSPGPVLFRQERIGARGRRFVLWKFRTMAPGADQRPHAAHLDALIRANAPLTKLDATDRRLIPGARLVRAAGLDELPQLWNVLRGEMSLVGPRPVTLPEAAAHADLTSSRANLLPGLTGYWQVRGKNRTTFRRMVRLDRAYGRRMSLALDLAILLRTLPAVAAQVLTAAPWRVRDRSTPPPAATSFPA